MKKEYTLIFDEVILKQLKQINNKFREILSSMFDKLEEKGPFAGKLLDSHLFIYEIKNKHPPIRLYFKHKLENNEIYVFEFEIKTSKKKQRKTVNKIRFKAIKM